MPLRAARPRNVLECSALILISVRLIEHRAAVCTFALEGFLNSKDSAQNHNKLVGRQLRTQFQTI